MRVAVSGGRDYRLTDNDRAFLDELHEAVVVEEGVEGGATGADAGFRDWCDENMIPVTTFHAAWRRPGRRTYDPSAGPKRNRRMARYVVYAPAVWVFFPGDRGTNDAYDAAMAMRATHPDLIIVDRRNVRGPTQLSEIRRLASRGPADLGGQSRFAREYRPPGGFGHGADPGVGNDDRG